MIPEEGSDNVDTGFALLPSIERTDSFELPDCLYPHAERNLQYQLYAILEEWGGAVYPEVRLGGDKKALDLVWHDPSHKRSIGIEVKRVATVDSASKQIRQYRQYTLDDVRERESVRDGNQRISTDDIYALDGVWLASYTNPRPKYACHDTNPDLRSSVPEADGYLWFDTYSGKLACSIDKAPSRETLWKFNPGEEEGELAEPEAPLVAELWRGLREEEFVTSAEALFSPTPEGRQISDKVRHQPHKSADLAVARDTFGCDQLSEFDLIGIEVKTVPEIKDSAQTVTAQLRDYVTSELFSRVYLAVPCGIVPDQYISGKTNPDFGGFGAENPLPKIMEAVPEVGLISIHQDRCHPAKGVLGAPCDDPFQIVQAEEGAEDVERGADQLAQSKVPFIKFEPSSGFDWCFNEMA